MSKNNYFRTRSFRKSIKPVIDIYEEEDNKRRDSFGRKRVDVIQCLLESSSDENDDTNIINQTSNPILWLTFAEICHIRSVLAQTTLSSLMFNKDKQYFKKFHDHLCFRCRKQIDSLFFIPSFLHSTTSFICYMCQQRICKKCSVSNFLPPSSKHVFPVRIQTLTRSSSSPPTTSIGNETNKKNESNSQTKTICYDCSQVTYRF
jgi:hypothetical protein